MTDTIYKCSIESDGIELNFDSDIDLFPMFESSGFTCFVPDMNVSRGTAPTPFSVKYRNSAETTIKFHRHAVDVRFPWDQMREGETILYLGYPFVELQWQQQFSLTTHAACVELDGVALLLLGKEGAGKTTLALQLCRQYGASLIANDLTVIGKRKNRLTALGGTKFFFLRYESIRRNLPELLPLFTEPNKDPWLRKAKVPPEILGITTLGAPMPVHRAYMVHVDETQREIFTDSADNLVTKLYLNENFSRYIRSTCTVMLGGKNYDFMGYIPSLDAETYYEMRTELIQQVMRQAEIQYISGPLDLVSEHIAQNST